MDVIEFSDDGMLLSQVLRLLHLDYATLSSGMNPSLLFRSLHFAAARSYCKF